MVMWEAILANGIMAIFFWGGIALCVRFDQQGKTRRRELEHIERIRAIELGRPLDDTVIARYRALGAVGVAVPIASLSAAAIGSCFALLLHEPEWRFGLLAVVWVVCGAVCLTSFSIPISVIAFPARFPEA
jgi:hypothetical protein